MVDIVQLGYDVNTSQVLKGDKALDNLTMATLQADKASKKFVGSANNLNRAASGAGRQGLRNMGLQLNQVAQQGAVTGNYMQALAIQMPDLLLGFGGIGIAAGIAAGALGPLALSMFDNADASNNLANALGDVESLAGDLDNTFNLLQSSADELADTYGLAANRVREFGVNLAELQIAQAASKLNDLSFSLNSVTGAFQDVLRDTREGVFASVGLRDALGVTQDQLITLASAFRDLDQASGLEDQQVALRNLLDTMEQSNIEVAKLPPELQGVVRELLLVSNEADRAAESMRVLAAEAAGVNVAGIGAAPRVGDNNLLPGLDVDSELKGRNRRGGGGKRDPYEQNLNRLVESLQTERETLEIWYADSEALLNDHRARKLLGEQEHKESLLALEERYQSRKVKLGDFAYNSQLSAASAYFGAVAAVAATGNDKLIRIARIAGGVEATINSYRAATQALSDPTVPFYAKAAAYAATLATGLGAVKAIKGTSAGGSGSAGISGGAAGGQISATAPTVEQTPTRVILDTGNSPEWVTLLMEDVLSNLQEASDQGVIIEVARS